TAPVRSIESPEGRPTDPVRLHRGARRPRRRAQRARLQALRSKPRREIRQPMRRGVGERRLDLTFRGGTWRKAVSLRRWSALESPEARVARALRLKRNRG